MQFLTLTTLTLSLLTTLTLADQQPVCRKTVYTCKGNLKCCSLPLQGTVAAYCAQGNIDPQQGCGMNVICCDYNAVAALTPRGYTYSGCTNPGRA